MRAARFHQKKPVADGSPDDSPVSGLLPGIFKMVERSNLMHVKPGNMWVETNRETVDQPMRREEFSDPVHAY